MYTLCWGLKKIPFTLCTYVLAKTLQNGAKVIQELTTGFKNCMRNLNNSRQEVKSQKSLNLVDFLCPKNTFHQLKHIQKIYLTLLSTTCVKIHQITYAIFETITHFSQHNSVSF